jgi:hypothetical protein
MGRAFINELHAAHPMGFALAQVKGMPEQLPSLLEPGGTEGGTPAGGARRYRKPLKSFRWRDIESIFPASFTDWSKHKAPRLGASLAFYTLLSIAPLLLVLVSVVGMVLGRQAAETDIVALVRVAVGAKGPWPLVLCSKHDAWHHRHSLWHADSLVRRIRRLNRTSRCVEHHLGSPHSRAKRHEKNLQPP